MYEKQLTHRYFFAMIPHDYWLMPEWGLNYGSDKRFSETEKH